MATVSEAGGALRHAIDDLETAARAEGISPDGPLGIFVAAMADGLLRFAEVGEQVEEALENSIVAARELTRAEIEKVQFLVRAANAGLQQAHSVQIQLDIQRETVVAKLIERIGPELSDEIAKWRVLKQTEYTLRYAYRTAFWAVLAALTLAATCYFGRAWQDREATAIFKRCLAKPVTVTQPYGIYCNITQAFAEAQDTQK
jgi:hypothetical protein